MEMKDVYIKENTQVKNKMTLFQKELDGMFEKPHIPEETIFQLKNQMIQ